MKKALFTILVSIAFISVYGQSNKEEIDLMQSMFGMQKKAIVAQFVQPLASQSDAFWQMYDAYETERKSLGQERLDLFMEYAQNYSTLTNEQADIWMKKVITLQKKTDNLIQTYYKKIKKVTSPIVATQFYQIENYILSAVRFKVLDSVPFVGEMK